MTHPTSHKTSSTDTACYYVMRLHEEIFEGPYTLLRLLNSLSSGLLKADDLVYRNGKTVSWMRIFELPELMQSRPKGSMTNAPSMDVLKHFRLICSKTDTTRGGWASYPLKDSVSWFHFLPLKSRTLNGEWHLLHEGLERGPLTSREILWAFDDGHDLENVYAWKKSMPLWKAVGTRESFAKILTCESIGAAFVQPEELRIERGGNSRLSRRQSIPACVMRISASGKREMVGICGDLAAEGFSLIPSRGSKLSSSKGKDHLLEIVPLRASKLSPFKVRATLRHVTEDSKMGFLIREIDHIDAELLKHYLKRI